MTDDPIRRIARSHELDDASIRPLFGHETRLVKARVVRQVRQVHEQLDAARQRAESVVRDANEDADAIRDAAREEGRDAGWREVLDQIAGAERARTDARHAAERDMLDLAFRLAQRIVGRVLDRDAAMFADLVADKLARVREAARVTVRVHPDDIAALQPERDRLASHVEGVPIQFEPDPGLDPGDCILETDRGRIDARIETQLDQLRRALQGDSDD